MPRAIDVKAGAAGVVALLTLAWTVGGNVIPPAQTVTAVLVPTVLVIAGLLGPIWNAARFTTRLLTAIGAFHLFAFAFSALAQTGAAGGDVWQAVSQVLYVAGFGTFIPLAAGYPAGPASRGAWIGGLAVCVLPVLGALSASTPTVLSGSGAPRMLGPIVSLLPQWVASTTAVVFVLPLVAVVVAVVRTVRGDRETRGRFLLPLTALVAFAIAIVVSQVLPPDAASVGTALFLISVPLLPVGLVAGSRPLAVPLDDRPPLPGAGDPALERLSPRERDVLAGMAAGESNVAIGRRLHISLSAVEKHTTAIFSKLDLGPSDATHRRVAAVVAYLRSAAR